MHISIQVSTLFVFVLLGHSDAAAVLYRTAGGIFEKTLSKTASCKEADVVNTFVTDGFICFDSVRWNDKFADNSAALTEGLEGVKFRTMIAHFGRYQGDEANLLTNLDAAGIKKMVDGLGSKAIENIPVSLPNLELIVPMMNKGQKRALASDIIEAVLGTMSAVDKSLTKYMRLINGLSGDVLREHLDSIINHLKQDHFSGIHLWKLEDEVLKALLGSDGFCEEIKPKILLSLGERKEKAKLVTPSCFAAVNWELVKCGRQVRFFPANSFEGYNGEVSKSCLALMLGAQAQNFARNMVDENDQCAAFKVEELSITALKSVTPHCIVTSYLRPGTDPVRLNAGWTVLPEDIMKSFAAQHEAIEKIHPHDWAYISLAQKSHLVTDPKKCEYLPLEFFHYRGGVDINQECFNSLRDDQVRAAALLYAHLPDDALAKISSLVDWKATNSRNESVTGIKVIELATHVRNIDKLIGGMSSAVDDDACSELTNIEMLLEMSLLQSFCSEKCFKAITTPPTLSQLGKLNPRVAAMVPVESLLETLKLTDWADMSVEIFRNLLASGKACHGMSATTVNVLPEALLKEINAKCGSELPWSDITPLALGQIPPSAFELVTGDIDFSKLSDDQFAALASQVPEDKHPAKSWSADTIKSLCPARAAVVTARTWGFVNPDALTGLTTEQFKLIPPSALVNISSEQVNKMTAVLPVMSVEQARGIGKQAGQCPLDALKNANLDANAKAVIIDRIATRLPKGQSEK
jgi:hypothetical protein